MPRPWRDYGGVFLLGWLLCLPSVALGVHAAHDLPLHAVWTEGFARALAAGDPYPRWLPELNGGLGSPAFFYYPPLAAYVTSALHGLLPGDGSLVALRLPLYLSGSLAVALSGVSALAWLRSIAARWPALAGAVAYMALPYPLQIDLGERFALAELWAFPWLPLALASVDGVTRRRPGAELGLATSIALLLLSHPPSALLFGPVPFLFASHTSTRAARAGSLLRTAAGCALGGGLAAAYLLPALTTQDAVSMEHMARGDLRWELNFLRLGGPELRGFRWLLFKATLLTSALCVLLAASAAPALRGRARVRCRLWVGVCLLASFLCLAPSAPVWRLTPLLHRVQFPWRLNVLIALACAAVVGLCAPAAWRALRRGPWGPRVLAGAALLTALGLGGVNVAAARKGARTRHALSSFPPGDPWQRALRDRLDAPEYLPRWVPDRDAPRAAQERLVQQAPAPLRVRGRGEAELLAQRPRALQLAVRAVDPTVRVEVRQLYYPGWQVRLNGGPPAAPRIVDGLLAVDVPQGEHRVELRLARRWPERVGLWLSAGALLVLLVLGRRRLSA